MKRLFSLLTATALISALSGCAHGSGAAYDANAWQAFSRAQATQPPVNYMQYAQPQPTVNRTHNCQTYWYGNGQSQVSCD